MNDGFSAGWIDAGKILATDAEKKVICPNCHKHELIVEDVSFPEMGGVFERRIWCIGCGSSSHILMRSSPQ